MQRFNPPPNWPEAPRGWRPGPGWRPDPAWGPAPPGWKFWVEDESEPNDYAPEPREDQKAVKPDKKSHPLRLMVLLFLGLVLVAVWQGGRLSVIKVGGENGVSAEFAPREEEVKNQQPELEERLTNIESELRNRNSAEPSSIDVSGMWQADNGFRYVFEQYGDAVAFSEQGAYGVTATGQGYIDGNRLHISFQAWNYSSGTSELVLNPDGSLSGTVTNTAQGLSFPIHMFRY